MFIVGLTGGIASGKSTIAAIFHEYGIPIIDADKISKEVVALGSDGADSIRREFGDGVFFPNGDLDRDKLAEIIFQDRRKRRLLNSIVHPLVRREMVCHVVKYLVQGYNYVILDVPLLFENKSLLKFISCTIVVSCSKEQQLERLKLRNNFTEAQATRRIEAQLPLADKTKLATYVIDNTTTVEDARRQVDKIRTCLHAKYTHWYLRLMVLGVVCLITTMAYNKISNFAIHNFL